MPISIRHSGVVVADLERALKFYRDVLGFEIRVQADESGPFIEKILGINGIAVTTVKMMAPNGGMLELLHFKTLHAAPVSNDKEVTTNGWTHVALTVTNLDGLYDKMRAAGVFFTTEPIVSPGGKAKVTFCRDPENNLIELVEEL